MKYENLKTGDVAISKAGHDAGTAYLVVKIVGEDFCLVSDGRLKKLDGPKLKRFRHLARTDEREDLAKKLEEGKLTDKALRAELKKYAKQER